MVVVRLLWFEKRLKEVGETPLPLLSLPLCNEIKQPADISCFIPAPHLLRPQLSTETDTEAQFRRGGERQDVLDTASLQEKQNATLSSKNNEGGVEGALESSPRLVIPSYRLVDSNRV